MIYPPSYKEVLVLERPFKIRLDIGTGELRIDDYIEAISGDTANWLELELFYYGNIFLADVPTRLITITFKKPDGGLIVTEPDTKVGNICRYRIGTNVIDIGGRVISTIEVYEGIDRLTTKQFAINVVPQLGGNNALSSSVEYPVLMQLITDVNTAEQQRQINEQDRIDAENQRQIDFDDMMASLGNVTPGGGGTGDMLQSNYDADGDGIIDKAKTLDSMTSTVAQLDQAVDDSHSHTNKVDVLDLLARDPITGRLIYDGTFVATGTIITKTSELLNDSNFITLADVIHPTNLSEFNNDTNYVTSADVTAMINGASGTSHLHSNLPSLERIGLDASGRLMIDNAVVVTGDMNKSTYDTDGDGVVDKAKTLDGMTSSVVQLDQTVANNHNHTRTDVQITNAVDNTHAHTNKVVIDGLTDNGGQLEYNGVSVAMSLTPADIKTMYESNADTYAFDSNYRSKVDALSASSGDMSKSTYDTDGDGIVDSALFAQSANALSGQLSSITEINHLVGVSSNIQSQINALKQGMKWKGEVANYASLPGGVQGDTYIVTTDETRSNNRTFYTHDGTSWVYLGEFTVAVRDFLAQPIDLATETTGVLQESKIDPNIARKTDLHNHNNKVDILDNLGKDIGTGKLTFNGVIVGGGGGSSTVAQTMLLGLTGTPTAPYVAKITIPDKPSYAHPPVNLLKSIPGIQDEVVTLIGFNEADKANTSVAGDPQVVFNGIMGLQTQQTTPMSEVMYGTGKMLTQVIDQSDKKFIEKIGIF